jgi:hypothetical protein
MNEQLDKQTVGARLGPHHRLAAAFHRDGEVVQGQAAGDVQLVEILGAVADGAMLAEDRPDVLPVRWLGRLRQGGARTQQHGGEYKSVHGKLQIGRREVRE